jgi:hypothetical protein
VFVGLKNGHRFIFPEGQFSEKKITSSEAIGDLMEEEVQDG